MLDLERLAERFASFGLPVSSGAVAKQINKASSSAYQDWQRSMLGGAMTVSDIDLVRLRDGSPIEVIELKRSWISVESWTLFQIDYPNFRLIWNLTSASNLKLNIVYNHRQRTPFFDDTSRVSIFSLSFTGQSTPWTRIGIVPLNYFISGQYLE